MFKTRHVICCFAVMIFIPVKSMSQPVIFPEPLSPRNASYDIKVRLEPETRVLHGEETVTFRNTTSREAAELQFHLYPNAFRNNQSTFLKEIGDDEKVRKHFKKNGWGYLEIESMELATGEDLTSAIEFIHPDDDNADDRTVIRVPLPRPVAPGETISVKIKFMTRLPEPPFARSGAKKEFFFVSQWFPKLGVFEEDGWNCHQYHAASEFYSDYGVYNVWITVPEKNIVGATGIEVEKKDNGDGAVTHWYHAEDVHDFAWTTSPNFVEFTGQSQDVQIRALMQKQHAYQGERHLEAARLAVQYFQDWYGDYPFPNLTVVDPRPGASGAGGMEYPTLITAGTFFGMPKGVRAVEMLIIHEFGHNYWYHLVGNNEFEEAWLDEGINTYSEIRIMHDIYGAEGSAVDLMGIKGDDLQMRRYSYVRRPDYDPTIKNAWDYYDRMSYGANAYSKPALALITLENHLGDNSMRDILREFLARWRFKHPHTQDFIAVAEEVSGQDLDWFFDQALYTNAALDYAVTYVSSDEVPAGVGYDYTLKPGEEKKADEVKSKDGEKQYLSVVKVRRLGEFRFPVELEVEFENGDQVRESWDGVACWIEYRYLRPDKLVKATVDPDQKVVLDLNWKNNQKTVTMQKKEGMTLHGGYAGMIKFMLDPD